MSDNTKRGERKDKENTVWTRRIEREFYNNNRKYVETGKVNNRENMIDALNPSDLKNSKYGEMLKHTSSLNKKNNWNDYEKKSQKMKDREIVRQEIDNSIMDYNYFCKESPSRADELLKELSKCNDEIFTIEEMLHNLPERLEGLKEMKKEIEEEICWLQYLKYGRN